MINAKYKIGDRLQVKAKDVIFYGLHGVVTFISKHPDGHIIYSLERIRNCELTDRRGKKYKIEYRSFAESWLKKIN